MAKKSSLEFQLTEITREFVTRIVETIRNASFAEVAGYLPDRVPRPRAVAVAVAATKKPPPPKVRERAAPPKSGRSRRPRQTADKRAELATRVLDALTRADGPIGVRALASEVGVAADLLAVPLRELRSEGRIHKHGEKRNTTYSAA
jgi:hypothetical protein